MDIAKKGEIHNLCHPNALLTFAEYLIDYANEKTQKIGWELIEKQIGEISNGSKQDFLKKSLEFIKNGKRDLFI